MCVRACVNGWVGVGDCGCRRVCLCGRVGGCTCLCVCVCVCMCVVGRRRGDVGVRVVEQERERQAEGDKIVGVGM